MRSTSLLALSLAVALAGTLRSQADDPARTPSPATGPRRAVPAKGSIVVDPAAHRPDLLVVKLAEGRKATLADGTLRLVPEDGRRDLVRVLGDRELRPFFAGLEDQLADLDRRIRARGLDPSPDLSLYLTVATRSHDEQRALIAALADLNVVELAYPMERPTPPPGDIPPTTPDFTKQQTWQGVAPTGFDAGSSRRVTGAWGKDIRVLDIEWGWDLDHEDIAPLRSSQLIGPSPAYTTYNNHGTAVGGELCADFDAFGVSGMCPDIELWVATDYPSTGYSVAKAIVVGLPKLRAGDVMLLEAQITTPLGLGPTEYVQADFDAIVKATKAGVLTVEAAGNGAVNLDDSRLNRIFDLTYRDSGALIVGASNGAALDRAYFSCYGSRIDANGWGGGVVTTGYGTLFNPGDKRQHYTNSFSGTSSASPMVTATVVNLLGAAKARLSAADFAKFADHLKVRALLRKHGTAMNSGQNIALRPDLDKLMPAAGLRRGLTILGDPVLGKSFQVEVEADFAAGPGDAWVLLVAAGPGNLGIPGLPQDCDRLQLDLASTLWFAAGGTWTNAKAQVTIPVPNDTGLKFASSFWQALTFRGSDKRLCLSTGAHAVVLP
ncbi:MAG: S8 family serine peptidase [Planctomycetota bacterium]